MSLRQILVALGLCAQNPFQGQAIAALSYSFDSQHHSRRDPFEEKHVGKISTEPRFFMDQSRWHVLMHLDVVELRRDQYGQPKSEREWLWRMTNSNRKVLAVASGGGHWEQLMLLRDTLENYDVQFATTDPEIAVQRGILDAETLPDCNQNTPLKAALCAVVAARIILKHRPHIVLSTGAAPGYFCLLAGRLVGARTLWIDSVANGEQLSMCGKLSQRTAHECLTQWEHVADGDAVKYRGAVL